jgi:DNA-binding transcriptional LysR family regulator
MDKFGELQVFLGVVAEGSFSGAGRRLARLETRLDVRLFERIGGAIRLTQEGRQYRAAGQRVVDAMDEAENLAVSDERGIAGTLHIHTPLTTAKYLLAPLLPALLERHPRLRLEFIIGTDRGDFMKQGIDVAAGRPSCR